MLPQLWALWELLLLGQPLMVVAPTPGEPGELHWAHARSGAPWALPWPSPLLCLASPLLPLPLPPAPLPAPPGACSSAVAALLALLAPFPYSLDYRPYFTIHDAAFVRLAAGEAPTAANGLPMLLGLTNLYFLKVGERSVLLVVVRRTCAAGEGLHRMPGAGQSAGC